MMSMARADVPTPAHISPKEVAVINMLEQSSSRGITWATTSTDLLAKLAAPAKAAMLMSRMSELPRKHAATW
jgi:hypothetical protein